MLFNSLIFLFAFLPGVLTLYFISKNTKYRNVLLLIASLFFYAWGEGLIVLVMIASILFNYVSGIFIDREELNASRRKVYLFMGIAFNLGLLIYYKYAYFIAENLNLFGFEISLENTSIVLPIGISFYTFQSLSYLVDVFRKTVPSQKNPINLGLYISLFPQLIAGPIVRYEDIYKEIISRTTTNKGFTDGILKFIRGLAKKVIIANNVALIADKAFGVPVDDLGTLTSWIGVLCYTLQIYFDFSGYSDMAIGLGRMFGFNIKENFKHPYIAKSIKEFWRRWHISLSTWFRDYLYIPLGGSRGSKIFTYRNLLIVFFITGLWHGASWNFVIWGLFHGAFILLERLISIRLPSYLKFLNSVYLILVVMIGWVLFRADTLSYAIGYLQSMFVYSEGVNNYPLVYLTPYVGILIGLGILFSAPIRVYLNKLFEKNFKSSVLRLSIGYAIHVFILLYSIAELMGSNYNPFIYFRF